MLTSLSNVRSRARSAIGARVPARTAARREDGFLIIEVLISALLLSMIAIATVTGLQAVNDSSSNQRFHNEAVELATQSQEQLRSSPVSALEKLLRNPHTFTTTVDKTTYTIKQEVHEFSSKEENTTCTIVEHGAYTAPNFRVSSTVSWSFLKAGKPVTLSSIITPPTSSSLEVDVGNAPAPTAGVAEVTVIVTYGAFETGTPIKVEGTTSSQGCVFFTGIRSTSATVEVLERNGFVIPSGVLKVPSSEVSLAPGLTTRDQVTYNQGGAIAGTFTHNGKTEFSGKKVTGDTFVVANGEMNVAPELEVGTASGFSYEGSGEEHYTAHTGAYASAGITAKAAHYERGDLFPFTSSWIVFAGDCAANNPTLITKGAIKPGEGVVSPGSTTAISAPESYVSVEALQGTEKVPTKAALAEALPAKITNLTCSTASPAPVTPNNAAAVVYTHAQHISGGALENPFQPFGKFALCVQAFESSAEPSKNRIDKFTYENTALEGAVFKLYPQELTLAAEKKAREEVEAKSETHVALVKEEQVQREEREAEESTRSTREAKEKALKTAAETETTARTTREAKEAAERKKWEEEEKAKFGKKITKAEREAKEKEQTTKREAIEAEEKAAQTKRKEEEATLKVQAEKEASAKSAREPKEKATKEALTKEKEASEAKSKEEEKANTTKEKLAAEGKAQKVESGSSAKC